ncbi:MAG: hypothetical protein AAF441_12880 [Pseudomonadota bacterium]
MAEDSGSFLQGCAVKFIAATLVVGAAAAAAWLYTRPAAQTFIAPVENPDGTVDYTLVARGVETIPGNPDEKEDQHWVLRFPKDTYVLVRNHEAGTSGPFSFNGRETSLASPPNSELSFFLDIDNLRFAPKPEAFKPHTAFITAWARQELYKFQSKHRTLPNIGFYVSFKKKFELRCKKGREISNGLFEAVDTSRDERVEFAKKLENEIYLSSNVHINKECGFDVSESGGRISWDYTYYKSKERPVAFGKCLKTRNGFNCRFNAWVDERRVVAVMLPNDKLTQLPRIYEHLEELFDSMTVEEKSNLRRGD